jgi:hypothetical protein
MKRDPDYLWLAIQVAIRGFAVLLAIGACRVLIAISEWVWR